MARTLKTTVRIRVKRIRAIRNRKIQIEYDREHAAEQRGRYRLPYEGLHFADMGDELSPTEEAKPMGGIFTFA